MFYSDQIMFCILISVFFAYNYDRSFKKICQLWKIRPESSCDERMNDNETKDVEELDKGSCPMLESLKFAVNYYSSFNSVMVFIGLTTQVYLYGVKLFCNLFAITIAFIIVGLTIQPFLYDLDKSIKTPYEYLEKRYKSKLIRILSALAGFLFLISFFSLFLCSIGLIIGTLFHETVELWTSIVIFGVFSLIASTLGGFNQSVKSTSMQFLMYFIGIVIALTSTFFYNKKSTVKEIGTILAKHGRASIFDTHVDLHTRYSTISQLISLPIPW
jgi:Na+/proline symporter